MANQPVCFFKTPACGKVPDVRGTRPTRKSLMAIKKSELYSSLWKSCDEPRGGMGASQYKDFRTHMFKGLHQEMRRSHPELERTEDMFDGTPSLFHLYRIPFQTILHRIQNAFMLPSPDPSFLASGALRF